MAVTPVPIDQSAYFLGLALDRILTSGRSPDPGVIRADADEYLIEPDDAEAERFRIELERDARANPDDW